MNKIITATIFLAVLMLGVAGVLAVPDDNLQDVSANVNTFVSISVNDINFGNLNPGGTPSLQTSTITIGGQNNVNLDIAIQLNDPSSDALFELISMNLISISGGNPVILGIGSHAGSITDENGVFHKDIPMSLTAPEDTSPGAKAGVIIYTAMQHI